MKSLSRYLSDPSFKCTSGLTAVIWSGLTSKLPYNVQFIHWGYNFLDVVFSSLSSNWGQNFTPGYKICNLVVNYEQNIEALVLQEEVHLAI